MAWSQKAWENGRRTRGLGLDLHAVLPGREADIAPAERLAVHHLVIDRWSRGSSSLHQRDPRAKLAALLVFLIVLSTTRPAAQCGFRAYAILLVIAANSARLPILGLAGRAALVLPFSATFALLTWWSGDSYAGAGTG